MDAEARHKITCHTPLTDAGVGDEKQLYTKAKKSWKCISPSTFIFCFNNLMFLQVYKLHMMQLMDDYCLIYLYCLFKTIQSVVLQPAMQHFRSI